MTEVRPLRAYAEVALGRQRSPAHDTGPHMVAYLRAANVKDGSLDLSDVKEMNFDPKEQAWFSLRPGDVLVTEGSGSLRAVGASAVWSGEIDGVVCFQNTLLRLRPRPSTDPRFLAWWCRYAFADGMFASIATGANIFHVSADRVRALRLTYLPLAQQRAIADFLDAETARIDALIAKKRRLIELLDERLRSAVESVLTGVRLVPLRRVADLLPGFTFPSHWFGPDGDGERLLRGINVGAGEIRWDDAVSLIGHYAGLERYRLRTGDLVLGMDRPFIGSGTRVAEIDESSAGALLVQRVCRIRVDEPAHAFVIRHALASGRFAAHVEPDLTGVSVPHLSESQIAGFEVPLLGDDECEATASRLRFFEAQRAELRNRVGSQIDLLVEHRQALITAAVTGDLDLAGVAA